MKILTYFGISGICLSVDYSLFLLLNLLTGSAVGAGAASYLTGVFLHYGLSRRHLFSATARKEPKATTLGRYVVTGLLGTSLTAAIVWYATQAGISPPIAKALAAVASFACVYLLRSRLFFHDRPETPTRTLGR